MKKKSIIIFLLVVIFSTLASIRFIGIDRDFLAYSSFFDELSPSYNGRFELGFVYFSLVIKYLTDSFSVLLFFCAAIALFCKLYLILKLPNYWYWLLVYALILFPLHEMTQIRAAIAIGLSYLGLYFLNKKNGRIIPFALFFLAISFQYSILIFSPFFLFSKKLKNFNWMIVLAFIFFPALILHYSFEYINYFNPLVLSYYIDGNNDQFNIFSVRNIILISILAIGFFFVNRLPREDLPWLYISLMGLSISFGLLAVPVFAHRLLELTLLSYFFWIPSLPRKGKFLGMLLLLFLASYMFFRALFIDPLFL